MNNRLDHPKVQPYDLQDLYKSQPSLVHHFSHKVFVSSECFKKFVVYLKMASGNKIFRIKVNDKQEIDQVILKLGSQQCLVLKLNANDDIVVYLNNYVTEMSAGF